MRQVVRDVIKSLRHGRTDVYRHDGIGNPVIGVDMYLKTALEAADEIEHMHKLLERCMWECDWNPRHNELVLAIKSQIQD